MRVVELSHTFAPHGGANVKVKVESGADRACIIVNGYDHSPNGLGLNMVVLSPSGELERTDSFDTEADYREALRLQHALAAVQDDELLLIAQCGGLRSTPRARDVVHVRPVDRQAGRVCVERAAQLQRRSSGDGRRDKQAAPDVTAPPARLCHCPACARLASGRASAGDPHGMGGRTYQHTQQCTAPGGCRPGARVRAAAGGMLGDRCSGGGRGGARRAQGSTATGEGPRLRGLSVHLQSAGRARRRSRRRCSSLPAGGTGHRQPVGCLGTGSQGGAAGGTDGGLFGHGPERFNFTALDARTLACMTTSHNDGTAVMPARHEGFHLYITAVVLKASSSQLKSAKAPASLAEHGVRLVLTVPGGPEESE